jgi:catechol 2,3-dioxygenase-like lactoylglutathione lyase family enzyme
MEQRISVVTLGVDDLERSRIFYERLGWNRALEAAEGVVFFQAGGMVFSLFPRTDLAKDSGDLPAERSGFVAFTLSHNVRDKDEVDENLREAERAGGTVVKPAETAFWGGYHGHFADPDGFLWEIAWNPGFSIAEDGSVRLPA